MAAFVALAASACSRADERPPARGDDAGGTSPEAGFAASSGAAASGGGGPHGGGPNPGGAGSPGASSGGSSSTGGAAVLVVPEPPHALDPNRDHAHGRRDGGAEGGPAYRTEPSALCVPSEWTVGQKALDAKLACRAGLDARVWTDDVPRGCTSCRFSFAEAITRRERRAEAHRDVCCFVTSETPAAPLPPATRADAGR